MLVVHRREGEKVMIGDEVEITYLGRDHRGVRLGITAPDKIKVHRREVWLRVQQEKASDAARERERALRLERQPKPRRAS